MYNKAYSFLFCGLLIGNYINGIEGLGDDPSINQQSSDSGQHRILGNPETARFGVFNKSCNVGFIVDAKENTTTLINGNQGAAVIIDQATQEMTYIPCGISDPESLLLDAFSIVVIGEGKESDNNCGKYSDEVLELVKNIFSCFFKVDEEKVDPKEGLDLFIKIATKLVELIEGDLNGLLELTDKGINVRQDLSGSFNFLEGLATVFKYIPGGLKGLIEKNVPLDLQEFVTAKDGVDSLIILLKQIGSAIDIGKDLGPVFNDPSSFLRLVNQLYGSEATGVNGILKVLSISTCYIKGEVNLEVVINVVIEVLVALSIECNENLKDSLNESLKNLLDIIDKLGATEYLSGLVSTIEDLMNGKLKLDGVDLSSTVDDLLEGINENEPLVALVKIILELSKSCKPENHSFLSILLVLILDFNSRLFVDLVKALGIDVAPQECDSNSSNDNFTCEDDEDLYDILTCIPDIKEVTKSLQEALTEASDGKIDLEDVVNNDDSFKLIKGVLQINGYCDFGACEDVLKKLQEIINDAVSLRTYFSIDICPAKCYKR